MYLRESQVSETEGNQTEKRKVEMIREKIG